jgi:predicted acyltransferase
MNPTPAPPAPPRVAAIDAFRGLVMLLMLAEVLEFAAVVRNLDRAGKPVDGVWRVLAHHQTHVPWVGASLHDLIQPGFSFLVGAALPFSLLARSSAGQGFGRRCLHALWRSAVLVLLGVFLASAGPGTRQTNWVFTNTLSQIGLGYFFLFLLGHLRPRWQWAALAAILVGYWAAFAVYQPDAHLTPAERGLKADWAHDAEEFAGHWNKNTNAGMAADRWFLNQFPRGRELAYHPGGSTLPTSPTWFLNVLPREKRYAFSYGGYVTLNFVPTLATMVLGLIAGGWLLRAGPPAGKFVLLLGTGLALGAAGLVLGAAGVCPVVKRIWTPTWVLYSGGWCFLFLAGFYALTDWVGYAGWAFPLRVVGANSILAYCLDGLARDFLVRTVRVHVGPDALGSLGPEYEPFLTGAGVLAVYWLILFWLYRRRIFLRV